MVLAELRDLATSLGVSDTTGMRRNDLIAEIKKRQSGGGDQLPLGDDAAQGAGTPAEAPAAAPAETPAEAPAEAATDGAADEGAPSRRRGGRRRATSASGPPPEAGTEATGAPATTGDADAATNGSASVTDAVTAASDAVPGAEAAAATATEAPTGNDTPAEAPTSSRRGRRGARREAGPGVDAPDGAAAADGGAATDGATDATDSRTDAAPTTERTDTTPDGDGDGGQQGQGQGGSQSRRQRERDRQQGGRPDQNGQGGQQRGGGQQGGGQQGGQNQGGQNQGGQNQGGQQQTNQRGDDDDDDEEGGGRRRGRRFRDRRRNRNDRGERNERGQGGGEPEVRDDDVLIPVAGILDVLDNYAFVRTSGYASGPNDVYVSMSLVRKHGLRRGDAVTGQVRQQREGEQNRQKFNPLVRIDSINGLDPEAAKRRPEFTKLTPLYPNERLRLETESHLLTTRVIDLVMPVGKGQRALIVSPPKAGKTMVLQAIANAITTNNPEVHLMVVLVDERPEEVTDMQRSVKGEVIASTFDRPPSDHTSLSELAIERAKRLVEMGHDVVVLLDSITRLGRAYNLAAPASGRILSGGVDSTALYPPKRFLGAARNIEDGGSLTIFATALVETGSTMDTVIFEEFKGTGNAELKLDRKLADKRIFPAIDPDPSGTRKEELLLSPDEMAVTHRLRRVLAALDSQQAIELVLDRLRKSRTNIEFLMQVAKTTPGKDDD
ncbi:transcription termination factor Rho [Actinomycetospora succinea]|uniref:Transcription termination factor Rho n=1 Tax=Actinomycetospora succinea TaxID=663603 RepID=A0A4V3DB52_9PSEU|nr:transcription termination factor Rho [Actinomycetospora succinea]TDQ65218.1 transcription termination factor Rho [Actinomycetospora succinea]